MKADAVSFLENFIRQSVGAQYVIPVYQRNYTWKKSEQVKKLMQDIETLIHDTKKKHFIGTIVYIVTENSLTSQERSVVDGQQRLTTIFLMLYALKSVAKEKGDTAICDALTSLYLENNASGDKYKLRLKPLVADDGVFEQIAKDELDEIRQQDSNVLINFEYMKGMISQWLDAGISYDDVIDAMRRLYIVYIILEQEDNPQQIFESINSTGMELTAADLIRNYIMMNKPSDQQETIYHGSWRKLEEIFTDSKKLESFFRFYLASKTYTLVSQKRLYEAFQVYWKETIKQKISEAKILEDILNYARHFKRLYVSKEKDPLGEHLNDFRRMSSEMPAPFMMGLLELLRKNEITNDQAKSVIALVNTYLIRRYIMGLDTSDITRFFPTYLKNVEEERKNRQVDYFVDICIKCLVVDTRQKKSFMPDDDQITAYLMSANTYGFAHTRWLLEKIEAKDNSVGIITENLSIEHVMPQKRSDGWSEVLELDQDKYDQYINRIGNLTLVSQSDNSSMSNKDFKTKKAKLKKTSHIVMNQYILAKDKWGIEEIDQRSKVMIGKIIELFPYYRPTRIFAEKKLEIRLLWQGEEVATGYLLSDRSAIVSAGSRISFDVALTNQKALSLREQLLAQEIIVEENGNHVLKADQYFTSTSTAAEFVIGGSRSGWVYWRDTDGVMIKDSPGVKDLLDSE